MLFELEKAILNRLLDSYENSKGTSNRRVIVQAKSFKEYNLNNIIEKKSFHNALKNLKDKGFIKYEWEKFEEDNLLRRVVLVNSATDDCYKFIGRTASSEICNGILNELIISYQKYDCLWIKNFISDSIKYIKANKKLPKNIPKDEGTRKGFFMLFDAIDSGIDTSERYLSARLFGDSKIFEKYYKNRLITIVKKYVNNDLEKNHALNYIGIDNNPEEILIKGELKYTLGDNCIDSSKFVYGTSLNKDTICNMHITELTCDRILTIENKATYYEYIKRSKKNELVIYLGGFFGKVARDFLIKIKKAKSELVEFYHWGDIDLGGLQIYKYLCEVLDVQIMPYKMDRYTYETYHSNEYKLNNNQIQKIKKLKESKCMSILDETIDALIETRYRLEQERIEIYIDDN